MRFDLVIREVSLAAGAALVDIGVRAGRIAALEPDIDTAGAEVHEGAGAFACTGFVDAHIHLDKACILERCTLCEGTLAEAVRETARAKAGFTEADVHARAARVVEMAILQGTQRMRSFVEVDPRAGLRSLAALRRIRDDYAFALDLELCAFAQEGLTNEPETLALLDAALAEGGDLVGGCPYTDPDPDRHVALIFDLAEQHGVPVDFHLDFDLDPAHTALPAVIAETERRGWQGMVTIGHVTNLSALPPARVSEIARRLAIAGIAIVALPATDLFLNGRGTDHLVPRGVAPVHRLAQEGVTAALATNNVLNPFTPFGDASLLRMANLYATLAQIGQDGELEQVFGMIGAAPARMLGAGHGLVPGGPADIVLLDAAGPAEAVRGPARALAGWKAGRRSFEAPRARLLRP